MSFEDYTWLKYYEDLYHRQKKQNNALAVSLGESEAKAKELQISLNRVVGSPFWKVLAPARKIYSLVKGEKRTSSSANTANNGDTAALAGYQNRLELLEDFYGQWIRKDSTEIRYDSYEVISVSEISEGTGDFAYFTIEDCSGSVNPLESIGKASWLVFTGENGLLSKGFEERVRESLKDCDKAVIAYGDEDYFFYESPDNKEIRRVIPNFKPDWSPDTLDCFFYLGNIVMLNTVVADRLTWLGDDDAYRNIYDLFLQAAELAGKRYDAQEVVHIPQILFHNNAEKYVEVAYDTDSTRYEKWDSVVRSLNKDLYENNLVWGYEESFTDIKAKAFKRRGLSATFMPGQFLRVRQFAYEVPEGTLISVLLLSKDHPEVLKTCINSFVERTDYPNLEFVIVDNGSSEANKSEYEAFASTISKRFPCKYIHKEMDFNFSAMCNLAAANAAGELFLFMNDDIEIIQKDWLKIMAGYAMLPHIGAVGAKLLYANSDKIQHVGVTSLEIGPSHKLVIFPDDKSYYFGKNVFNHDMLGVTAACLLITKSKYNRVGGFNEEFAVAYNDVDFCMKLAEAGFDNLQCNAALLYHYESMTRGLDADDADKWNRLLCEKEKLYSLHPEYFKHDPYYNKNLIGNHSLYLSDYDFGYNNHLKNAIVTQIDARKLAEDKTGQYKISVDFAGLQEKENRVEPDIFCIRGWSFMPGKDNSSHAARIILAKKGENSIFEVETDLFPREDLEKTFADEKNVRLCGFVARILKEDLSEGTYRIGIMPVALKHDLTDFEPCDTVVYTDAEITI